MPLRILIANGHESVLDGLAALLADEPDMELVGRALHSRGAVDAALRLEPDVIVLGVPLPGSGVLDVTRRILAERPQIKILCLSMHRERQYVSAALAAGAVGYVFKDRASEGLIEAVRGVAEEGVYVDPEVGSGV